MDRRMFRFSSDVLRALVFSVNTRRRSLATDGAPGLAASIAAMHRSMKSDFDLLDPGPERSNPKDWHWLESCSHWVVSDPSSRARAGGDMAYPDSDMRTKLQVRSP